MRYTDFYPKPYKYTNFKQIFNNFCKICGDFLSFNQPHDAQFLTYTLFFRTQNCLTQGLTYNQSWFSSASFLYRHNILLSILQGQVTANTLSRSIIWKKCPFCWLCYTDPLSICTWFLKYQVWFFQATQAVKIMFKIDQKVHPTWFFKLNISKIKWR